MSECWNCGEANNEYDIGYFEGIRMVVLEFSGKPLPANFRAWLNEELKEALRLRDEE